MDDDRRGLDPFQVPDEVKITQAFPHRLLHPTDDSEGSKVPRLVGIGEISGHSQLKSTLAVRCGIALPESGRRELVAQALDLGAGLTTRELRLELPPILQRQRRRIDQRDSIKLLKLRIFTLLDRVQQSKHRSPRIANDRQWIEPELFDNAGKIFDVGLPGDGNPRVRLRFSAAPLVVK